MNKLISRPVSAALVMVYGNDIVHKALILAGRFVRLLLA
jgi:hypothetical protein